MEKNLERLQVVFNEVFEDCPTISIETKKEDILSWDSMSFLNLIVELEDAFDVQLSVEQIEKINSVKSIIAILD